MPITYLNQYGAQVAAQSKRVVTGGEFRNDGNAPITVTLHLRVNSNGVLIGEERKQTVEVPAYEARPLTVEQAVSEFDPPGTLAAVMWVEGGGKEWARQANPSLAVISAPNPLELTGNFAFERQVRYAGGLDSSTVREVFVIITAYVKKPGTQTLTVLRGVKSGNFTVPTASVPQVVVPVYSSDPSGELWGGIKVFDAPTESLLRTTRTSADEFVQGPLWALNSGSVRVDGTPSGQAQNYRGEVGYSFSGPPLKNTGDAPITVRVRASLHAMQGSTNYDFGEIPGTIHQQDFTIPAGSSVTPQASVGPLRAPQPFYDYIAYGNYVMFDFRVSAVSGGSVTGAYDVAQWQINPTSTIFF